MAATLRDRDIVMFYDDDEAAKKRVGQTHAAHVALSLCSVSCKLRVIDLPLGKDVSDFLDAGDTKEALERLIAEAPYVGADEIPQMAGEIRCRKPGSRFRRKRRWRLA